MRWGIRNQILLPFAVVLAAAVALTAFSSAYLAAERSEREINDRLNRVMETLGRSDFPHSQNVLEMMRGLSGAEFVGCGSDGQPLASTLRETVTIDAAILKQMTTADPTTPVAKRPVVELGNARYFAAGYRRVHPRGRAEILVVLYPEEQLRTARRDAAVPPLVIGGLTLVVLVVLSAWLAGRMGHRIRTVQEQIAQIAGGDFREMPLGKTRDEIFELIRSVNQTAKRLRGLQETIERSERSRLLGQLAGGLAHQLRNAVTGARLAIQIHQRRCAAEDDAESLAMALRQLKLMEEHIKSLLAVGKPEQKRSSACRLETLLDDVAALVSPVCRHEDVTFSREWDDVAGVMVDDSESLHTAVLNLALNAVEATGPNGGVSVRAVAGGSDGRDNERQRLVIEVIDDGPGPPPELQGRLFEAFVTGKREGVGLGLALVKQFAEDRGGDVCWNRIGKQTVFRLSFPISSNAGPTERTEKSGNDK